MVTQDHALGSKQMATRRGRGASLFAIPTTLDEFRDGPGPTSTGMGWVGLLKPYGGGYASSTVSCELRRCFSSG